MNFDYFFKDHYYVYKIRYWQYSYCQYTYSFQAIKKFHTTDTGKDQ